MSWFVVRTRLGALTPFHVRIDAATRAALPDQAETAALHSLIDMVRHDDTRISFAQPWRSFSYIVDGQPQGPALSKVQHAACSGISGACHWVAETKLCVCAQAAKLQDALVMRLSAQGIEDGADAYVRGLMKHLWGSWDLNVEGPCGEGS